MRIVIKIGHALFRDDSLDLEKIRGTADVILKLHEAGHRVIVIVGGGGPSRNYINAARSLGADLATCDEIGIMVTRLNALLLSIALGDAASRNIIGSFEDLEKKLDIAQDKILVGGGFSPAQSTDAVAALVAERIKADLLIKTTDVNGVYEEDPEKNPNAKLLKEVSIGKLVEILSKGESKPGEYRLLDRVSISILERSKIPIVIINGSDPLNILRVVSGEEIGTRVAYSA
ncbi:MAG: UMP kinase [Crenarchaeota archaeon]|nr:UMP kinase [Thermoproteota archaeon]MDW8034271.1 UMP kinase [Nitrososphaerota archaeon]